MVKLELVLSLDEADMILRGIERAREVPTKAVPAAPHEDASAEGSRPSRADGGVEMAESFLAGTLEDGTHLCAESFRRVACDRGLVAAGADGEALNS